MGRVEKINVLESRVALLFLFSDIEKFVKTSNSSSKPV